MTQVVTHSDALGTGETPVSRDPVPPTPSAGDGEIPCATMVYLTPIGDFIHSADGKAGTVLAVLGLMFTLLARFGPWLDLMVHGRSRAMTVLALALVSVFALAALGAVVQAFRTISPRFPKSEPSLVFFGDLARLTPEQYLARARSLGTDAALAERLKYNHTGARIILLKTAQLWWALRFFEVAALAWLTLATVLAWKAFTHLG
jgi:hypothetical protein